jgi:hypothetical protein
MATLVAVMRFLKVCKASPVNLLLGMRPCCSCHKRLEG